MYPILVHWGDIIVPSWHVMFALGGVLAFYLFQFNQRQIAPDTAPRDTAGVFLVCYVFGYLGARALSAIVEEGHISPLSIGAALFEIGPMTFYGGAVGGFLGGIGFCLWRGLPVGKIADAGLPALLLALSIGRLGCFLNGDDYGIALSPPGIKGPFWSVVFPNLQDNVARLPIQLIESAFAATICIGASLRIRRGYQTGVVPGELALWLAVSYSIFRFIAEYGRGDERGWIIEGVLSPSQGVSILVFGACLLLCLVRRPAEKRGL